MPRFVVAATGTKLKRVKRSLPSESVSRGDVVVGEGRGWGLRERKRREKESNMRH